MRLLPVVPELDTCINIIGVLEHGHGLFLKHGPTIKIFKR